MKEIIKLGNVARTGEHQSGIVLSKGGQCSQNTQHNGETLQRQSEIVILGGIGYNDRQNRDSKRVLDGKGTVFCLKSHISLEPPLVIRRIYGDMERYRGV